MSGVERNTLDSRGCTAGARGLDMCATVAGDPRLAAFCSHVAVHSPKVTFDQDRSARHRVDELAPDLRGHLVFSVEMWMAATTES